MGHKKAKDEKEAQLIRRSYQDEAFGFLQWGGSNVCFNLHCECGEHTHIDSDFLFYAACPKCKAVYYLNPHIEVIQVENPPEDIEDMSNIGIVGSGF